MLEGVATAGAANLALLPPVCAPLSAHLHTTTATAAAKRVTTREHQ